MVLGWFIVQFLSFSKFAKFELLFFILRQIFKKCSKISTPLLYHQQNFIKSRKIWKSDSRKNMKNRKLPRHNLIFEPLNPLLCVRF